MAKIKRLTIIFIGIFLTLVLSASVCPPGSPEAGESLSPDWLLNCSHCVSTPTPPISVPTPFGTPEPSITFVGARQCTEQEITDGCFETQYPIGAYKCYCWDEQVESTPIGGGNPPPLSTPNMTATNQAGHYYLVEQNINLTVTSEVYSSGNWNGYEDWTLNLFCGQGDTIKSAYFFSTLYGSSYDNVADIDVDLGYADLSLGSSNIPSGTDRLVNYSRCKDKALSSQGWCSIASSLGSYNWTATNYGTWTAPTIQTTYTANYHSWKCYDTGYATIQKIGYLCYGTNEPSPPQPTLQPTIQPTLTDLDAYCSVYDYANTDPVATAPNITIQNGSCFTVLPAFSLDIPAVGNMSAFTISWESFKLCPVWIDITAMQLFDITIPMELLIVPFLMFLITMVMRL